MKKILFMMLLVLFFLSGCGPNEEDDLKNPSEPNGETTMYSVTFFDADMNVIKEVEVALGEDAIAPNDPVKDGYTFNEWSENFEDVSSDLMIYPIFVPNMYNIYYYSDGVLIEEWNNLTYQENIAPLYVPSKEGYIFAGWYVREGFDILFNGDSMPYNDLILYAEWIPESTLATEKLTTVSSILGNTNGNLQNNGLSVYDFTRNLHIYSVGHSVYRYDPATEETLLLFTTGNGRAIYLNMYNDYLYYIDTNQHYLMRYHMVDGTKDVVSEKEYYFLARDQSYIFAISFESRWGEDLFVLRFYKESNDSFSSLDATSVEHLNVYGVRIYYTDIDGVNLQMSGSSFMGHVTIRDFTQDGLDEIDQLILQKVTQDYDQYFGMLALRGSTYGFYLYNTIDGLTEVTRSSNLRALNFDGEFYYYIDGLDLVKVDPNTLEKNVIATVPPNMDYINIIHHWIYYGDYEGDVMRRIHPDTLEVEVLND